MKAIGFNKHGNIDKMTLLDIPKPKPAHGQILVEMQASAYNHLDVWVREGWHGLKLAMPHVSGSDGAGVVVSLGEGVNDIKIGTRVALDPGINRYQDEFTARGDDSISFGYVILGEHVSGTHAEFMTLPAENAVPIPDHVSFEEAAAAGLVYLTAWRMLIHQAKLRVGQSVLIIGAGGGVNSAAIQIAKLAGCTVYATTSTLEKEKRAKLLGADVVLNYVDNPAWSRTLYKLTAKQGVDVVVDNVGAATIANSIRAVKRGGKIVLVGSTSGPMTKIDLRLFFTKQISLIGSTMGSHHDYRTVMNLVFEGKLKPVIHTVMPLEQGVEAMALLERGEQFGKVVLSR
ncbi:MAG: hypothetical protein B6242_06990 [Anaerolineaceae bacterium 4572_78]|nr:MAG: hypothetical protein B6242_06990 [Anaerolineaceae bacterium 4572_78]